MSNQNNGLVNNVENEKVVNIDRSMSTTNSNSNFHLLEIHTPSTLSTLAIVAVLIGGFYFAKYLLRRRRRQKEKRQTMARYHSALQQGGGQLALAATTADRPRGRDSPSTSYPEHPRAAEALATLLDKVERGFQRIDEIALRAPSL